MLVMLIGERPGLSAPDSLGAYLTFAPRIGLTDAERNCVSNIHGAGLSYDEAALQIAWLVREGLNRQITGVALKDESGAIVSAGECSGVTNQILNSSFRQIGAGLIHPARLRDDGRTCKTACGKFTAYFQGLAPIRSRSNLARSRIRARNPS